jgi:hypothetical protein
MKDAGKDSMLTPEEIEMLRSIVNEFDHRIESADRPPSAGDLLGSYLILNAFRVAGLIKLWEVQRG